MPAVSAARRQRAREIVPAYFGFDSKRFPKFRDHQLELALSIVASDKRFHGLDMPPGGGKSMVALLTGIIAQGDSGNHRTLVLTATKSLQDQYGRDASTLAAADIRGQQNYRCVALDKGGQLYGYDKPGSSCAQGPCRVGIPCSMRHGYGCGYYDAVRVAADELTRVVLGNYALHLALARHSNPQLLGAFDLLVLDECQNAPNLLTDFCAIELNRDELQALLGLKLPPADEGNEVWRAWAKDALQTAERRELALNRDKRGNYKVLLRLKSLIRSLEALVDKQSFKRTDAAMSDVAIAGETTDWITFSTPRGVKLSPVWSHHFAEDYLFRGIKKVLLVSGTLMPSIKRRLGIGDEECEWHKAPSAFDPKRRPVIYWPVTRMDQRAVEGQYRMWMRAIDQLIGARLDRKILIPSVSYQRAKEIKQRSKFGAHMLVHTSDTTRQAIEKFKRAKPPCILVSPAVDEGVNFPYDELRCIIIVKVPFGSAKTDPVYKARCKQDPSYRFEEAALRIVQQSFRGMRADDDMLEVVIIDEHFGYLRWKVAWPDYYKEAWREERSVPAPLQLVG